MTELRTFTEWLAIVDRGIDLYNEELAFIASYLPVLVPDDWFKHPEIRRINKQLREKTNSL